MNIQFSTSCKHTAKKYMESALGKYADKAKAFIEFACEQVERGVLRIGDPMMYGHAAPYPTNKSTDADIEALKAKYDEFMKSI